MRFLHSVVEEMDRHPARVVSFEDLLVVLDRAVPTFDEGDDAMASARDSARDGARGAARGDLAGIAEAKLGAGELGAGESGSDSPGAKGMAKESGESEGSGGSGGSGGGLGVRGGSRGLQGGGHRTPYVKAVSVTPCCESQRTPCHRVACH